MTIYGVRYCDSEMLRFFSTREEAQEFITHMEYGPTCYQIEEYTEVAFANFVLGCFNNVDAVLKAHRLGGM